MVLSNSPFLSIIVPVYNVESFLFEALNSVLTQDFQNFELIIIDDGSTDDSSAICERVASRDDRVIIIKQSNRGLSAARNAGLNNARGDYIYFFDSDDILESGGLQHWYDVFAKENVEAILFSGQSFVDDNGQKLIINETSYKRLVDVGQTCNSDEFVLSSLKDKSYFSSACCFVVSKRCYTDLRFKSNMLHEDELFTIELFGLSRRSVFIDPRIWFLRRIRDGSIMNIPKSSLNFNGYETCFSDFASTAKSLRGINGSEVTLELLMLSMQRVLLVQIDTFSRMQGILLLRYRLKIFNNVYAYIKLFSFDLKIALLCILPDIKILYRLFLRLKKSNSVEK